jgi:hypothetical protein
MSARKRVPYVEPTTRFAVTRQAAPVRRVPDAEQGRRNPKWDGLQELLPAGYHGGGVPAYVRRTGGRSHT